MQSDAEISYRAFAKKDRQRCVEIMLNTWPMMFEKLLEKDKLPFARMMLDLNIYTSTWLELVCISDDIVGFLFAVIDRDITVFKTIKAWLIGIYYMVDFLFLFPGSFKGKLKYFKNTLHTNFAIAGKNANSDAQISILAVDSTFRGLGLGQTLVNHLLEKAKQNYVKKITVFTDSESNWGFYEKHGFDYIDKTEYNHALFDEQCIDGYIYHFDVKKNFRSSVSEGHKK